MLVGLVDRRLDPAGGFRALVPPEFLELAQAAGRAADSAAEAVMRRKERSA
ncbi:MAG: hypothetical protein IRY92_12205 [Dactylosporangium sp.]|nr:hypothetical protein [Dactylosporangium sp.]